MTSVVDAGGRLAGIITDGDLRRKMGVGAGRARPHRQDVMTRQPRRHCPHDARRRGARRHGTAEDHVDRRDRRRRAASRGSCTCTTSGARRWCSRVDVGPLRHPHRGAPRAARRPRHRQGLGTLQAARRHVDRPPARPRVAPLRARPQLPGVQPDRPGDRGAEPGRPRGLRCAGDSPDPRQRATASAARWPGPSRCTSRSCSGPSSRSSSTRTCCSASGSTSSAAASSTARSRRSTRCCSMDPDNQYALLYLQKLHEEQHQWAEAHRIRKQLVELSGPDTPAAQPGDPRLPRERAGHGGDLRAATARARRSTSSPPSTSTPPRRRPS